MRRFSRTQIDNQDSSDIDLTPMLDVVFIMLIFFVVTASFVKESGIEVNTPGAQTAEVQPRANILIAIDANNDIWINRRKVDESAVRANIERLHAENPKGTVVVQADIDARAEILVSVMDSARLAGVYDISLAAKKE